MKDTFLIGVDVGVSYVKAGVYDRKGGCIKTVSKPAPGEYPKPGVFIQKNEEYLSTVVSVLTDVVEISGIDGNNVAAVGFSGAMGGATGVDADWNVIFNWSILSDTRYHPYVTHMQDIAGSQISSLSGTNFPIFAPKLLWWKNKYPDQYKKVRKFLFLCGFLVGRLCEIPIDQAFTDRTYMQISSLADIRQGTWSDDICNAFEIEKGLLPVIVDSCAIVGKLSKKYAGLCGLQAGTPFIAGAGDKPAGSLGAGMVDPGILIDESASYGALSLCVDQYVPDTAFKTLEVMPSPLKGHYYPWFYIIGSGVSHTWFKDTFGSAEQGRADDAALSGFAVLDEKAATVPPGSEGLLALGLLGGRGFPSDPDIRGMWIGHTWTHKKEHFYRSLLESFAYEYGCVLNVMRKTYPELVIEEVRVIGGGAQSDLWNQIKCDVMGIPYTTLNRDDFALLGDILLAGNAVGIFTDIKKKARELSKKKEGFTPDPKKHRYYAQYMKIYESVFAKVRDIYVELKDIR